MKALAVAERYPERLTVTGVVGHRNVELLAAQVRRHRPEFVGITDLEAAESFDRSALPPGTVLLTGPEAAVTLAAAAGVDLVVNAMVGGAGLPATLAAVGAGRTLALANKESIVLAGQLVMRLASQSGARILPIDSEHSGLFQCLAGVPREHVRRVILTASGGPFRNLPSAELGAIDPDAALNHPVWPMGARITIDSATLLNKGFEVIEAHWLFDIPPERIDVLIHPQAYVHAFVELIDGSILGQMAPPDMLLPVQYALSWPERWPAPLPSHDPGVARPLEFALPDVTRFPALALAYRALREGGLQPARLNAADEVAVEAFLDRRIRFTEIPDVLVAGLTSGPIGVADSLEVILAADRDARAAAETAVERLVSARRPSGASSAR